MKCPKHQEVKINQWGWCIECRCKELEVLAENSDNDLRSYLNPVEYELYQALMRCVGIINTAHYNNEVPGKSSEPLLGSLWLKAYRSRDGHKPTVEGSTECCPHEEPRTVDGHGRGRGGVMSIPKLKLETIVKLEGDGWGISWKAGWVDTAFKSEDLPKTAIAS